MSGEMIERVAKAISGSGVTSPTSIRKARAAVLAMRAPTEAMCDAMEGLHLCRVEDAKQIWPAMIDEALK